VYQVNVERERERERKTYKHARYSIDIVKCVSSQLSIVSMSIVSMSIVYFLYVNSLLSLCVRETHTHVDIGTIEN